MPRYTPDEYRAAKPFLDRLNSVRRQLTRETYLTLKGQALRGDIDGAVRGLSRILARKAVGECCGLADPDADRAIHCVRCKYWQRRLDRHYCALFEGIQEVTP